VRLLLDEQLPVQLLEPLGLNRGHKFEHVNGLGWKGKPDELLFADAAGKGFDALVSSDLDQLADPVEARALKAAAIHHIGIRGGRRAQGIKGTARLIAAVIAAMPSVLEDLEAAPGQRVVEISTLSGRKRHEVFDPKRAADKFPYW
jgi:hypothetical protein